jgi:hypothetical protein
MQDRTIDGFRWDGQRPTPGRPLAITGAGPEPFATPWPQITHEFVIIQSAS